MKPPLSDRTRFSVRVFFATHHSSAAVLRCGLHALQVSGANAVRQMPGDTPRRHAETTGSSDMGCVRAMWREKTIGKT